MSDPEKLVNFLEVLPKRLSLFHQLLILASEILKEYGAANPSKHSEPHHPQKSLLKGILPDVLNSVWPDEGVAEEDQ